MAINHLQPAGETHAQIVASLVYDYNGQILAGKQTDQFVELPLLKGPVVAGRIIEHHQHIAAAFLPQFKEVYWTGILQGSGAQNHGAEELIL